MNILRFEIYQDIDETGEPEEFTWDLFPLVHSSQTIHLQENGLPKIATHIKCNMIIVGKMGKTKEYTTYNRPSCLEIHGLPFEKIKAKYGNMWRDTSLYATNESTGVVKNAYFENTTDGLKAVIELEKM